VSGSSEAKTEQPTHKKLEDARKEGDVPYSKDFTQTMLTLALLCYVVWNGNTLLHAFGQLLLIPAGVVTLDFNAALKVAFEHSLKQAVSIMWPFFAVVLGVGFFIELMQTGFLFAVKKIIPSGKKLNVVANIKNIFSSRSVVEVIKSSIKILCFAYLVMILIRNALEPMVYMVHGGLGSMTEVMAMLFQNLLLYTAIFCLILAGFDIGWQRFSRRKRLMMTKQEVTREFKEMEGQPIIKQTRKRLHQEMANSAPTAAVRKASTLVVNPTHFAVAIWYESEETTPLPMVLAKGSDQIALKMIEVALEVGVPVMRDAPLARALFADARENDYIPGELIVPVAQVLRLVRDFVREGKPIPPGTGIVHQH